jgi:hypothetical protein
MSQYAFKVAGVSHDGRQQKIALAAGVQRANPGGVLPFRLAEPTNPHDPNAIGVHLNVWYDGTWRRFHIGYVPASMTAAVKAHTIHMRWMKVEFPYHTNFGAKITYEVSQ